MVENKQKVKNKEKSNRTLYIILATVVGLLILCGAIIAFVLNYNQSAPDKVSIVDDGKAVYVQAEMNDNYRLYSFKFVNSQDGEILIESENNTLTIEDLLENGIEIGKTYEVSVCYLAQNEGNNSQYSQPITWTVYTFLDAPIISYDTEEELLSWQAVENAQYYLVYYNGLTDPIQTENTYLDLQTIVGGEREFYVQAISGEEVESDKKSYKDSPFSNKLNITVVHKFLDFTSVSFDEETKEITITGSEDLDSFYIYLSDTPYECIDFEKTYSDGVYTYKVNINILSSYNEGDTIGASPRTIDEYNIFDGQIVYASQEG